MWVPWVRVLVEIIRIPVALLICFSRPRGPPKASTLKIGALEASRQTSDARDALARRLVLTVVQRTIVFFFVFPVALKKLHREERHVDEWARELSTKH